MNDREDEELREVALRNAQSILRARQRAEQELIETRERLTLALSAGRMGDWSWDARADEVVLGTSAAEIFGIPDRHRLSWAALRELLHEEDRDAVRRAIEEALRTQTSCEVECRVNRPAGGQCWIAANGRGIYAAGGAVTGIVGVVQDITARKSAEEALRRESEAAQAAREHAEHMSALKDEFLATLSHELRTPLSAILGWAQVLRRRRMSEEELQRGIDIIERNARVQTQLIEDLLDMSRITSGKLRLDIQPSDPASFIEAALDTVRPAATARGIRLDKVLDPAAGPIPGDPARLQQVMWNLLSNAIKFTPRGGTVQVLLQRVDSHVEIAVADTGIGIAPDFLAHVFERFRQADASTTRKHGGLGLGLSIVRHLIELHGGSVRACSAGTGGGTTFTIQLPLGSPQPACAGEERLHPRAPAAPAADYRISDLSGIKVLVVDDEPDARALLGRVLEDCGAEVVVAGSGHEALVILMHQRPQLLVCDIGMPDMDGYELLKRVRALEDGAGRLPAVALTAFARSEDRTRALRAGFLLHVAKPVEPAELVATVASVAGRAAA